MADAVLVTVQDGIAVVTINRPAARNAVNSEVARGLAGLWTVQGQFRGW